MNPGSWNWLKLINKHLLKINQWKSDIAFELLLNRTIKTTQTGLDKNDGSPEKIENTLTIETS